MGDWSAVYLRMDLGADPGTAAWGFAAFSLAMAAGRFTGDRLVERLGAETVLGLGAALGGGALGLAVVVSDPLAALLGFAGVGLGLANIVPLVFGAAARMPGVAPGLGIAAVSTRAMVASSPGRR